VNTARSSHGAVPPPCGRELNDGSNGATSYGVLCGDRSVVHGADYVELNCSGRAVGDCRVADPTVEGAATARRNAGHAAQC
jgi:hypothetical protein